MMIMFAWVLQFAWIPSSMHHQLSPSFILLALLQHWVRQLVHSLSTDYECLHLELVKWRTDEKPCCCDGQTFWNYGKRRWRGSNLRETQSVGRRNSHFFSPPNQPPRLSCMHHDHDMTIDNGRRHSYYDIYGIFWAVVSMTRPWAAHSWKIESVYPGTTVKFK